MVAPYLLQFRQSHHATVWQCLLVLLSFTLLLASCNSGGDTGTPPADPDPTDPQLVSRGIEQVLTLYQTALMQEDIDRLQELLVQETSQTREAVQRQEDTPTCPEIGMLTGEQFRADMTERFRRFNLLDIDIQDMEMHVVSEPFRVSFQEAMSLENPNRAEPTMRAQQTCVSRLTFHLTRRLTQDEEGRTISTFLIREVIREAPLFQFTMRGQALAGAQTRVRVTETTGSFSIREVKIEVPKTDKDETLVLADGVFHGVISLPNQPSPEPLQVRIHSTDNTGEIVFPHQYRLRAPDDAVVHKMAGTNGTRFFSVALAPDGTAWFGGEMVESEPSEQIRAGNLVQVDTARQTLLHITQPLIDKNTDVDVASARIADIAVDRRGRVQAVFMAENAMRDIVGNGVLVLEPDQADVFCQTVNAFGDDQDYPFNVPVPDSTEPKNSPSTRVLAADSGAIWLFGSDGGVARAEATYTRTQTECTDVNVAYDPVFRRMPNRENSLPSNAVPALVVDAERPNIPRWFGTALGIARYQDGVFTRVRFPSDVTIERRPETLEGLFQEIAQAIFEARPITTIDATFGELIKAELIFSGVEDMQDRLWVGTLGGGIRRIEAVTERFQDTLHLTRTEVTRITADGKRNVMVQSGLGSNIILALALGPEGAVWAATDEGVSRIQEQDGKIAITNFSALDGLTSPVWDLAVDDSGTVWLATDAGLAWLLPQGGLIGGVVRDASGQPVAGVEVVVEGTPFRAVTDSEGRYMLRLPPGSHFLRFDGNLANGGPFLSAFRGIEVTAGQQSREDVALTPQEERDVRLVRRSEDGQIGVEGSPRLLVAEVQNAQGNPIPIVPVVFNIIQGVGTLSSATENTDANGQADTMLTVGAPGLIRVEAKVSGVEPVVFTVHGVARDTVRLIEVSGDNQVAEPGEELPKPLVVRLEDQFGNPIVGQEVAAEVIEGEAEFQLQDGSDSMTIAMTDTQGEVRFCLRAGMDEGRVITRVSALDQEVQFLTAVGFVAPFGIAVEADGSLVVVDLGLAAVIRVDSDSDTRTIVSAASVGAGPPFISPFDIAVEADGSLIVVDSGGNPSPDDDTFIPAAVVRVDPRSGDRHIVSGGAENRGGGALPLRITPGIAIDEADGSIVVIDQFYRAVIQIDPQSGTRTMVSGANMGTGPPLVAPLSIVVEADGSLVVVDAGSFYVPEAVVRVDPRSGDRDIVSGGLEDLGQGPLLEGSKGITIEADGTLVVADGGGFSSDNSLIPAGVVRVDPRSGDRTIVSGGIEDRGQGPLFLTIRAIAIKADNSFVVGDIGRKAVMRVEPVSGDRTIVSEAHIGSGPPFEGLSRIAVGDNGSLLAVDNIRKAVLRVDPRSGDRDLVSGDGVGSGPSLVNPIAIAIEIDGSLVVIDQRGVNADGFSVPAAVFRVDPDSGVRTVVSSNNVGSGPSLVNPIAIAIEIDGSFVVVDLGGVVNGTSNLPVVLRVDPHNGDRDIVSGGFDDGNSEPPLVRPIAIAVEDDGFLVVLDCGNDPCPLSRSLNLDTSIPPAVIRVDPQNGNRDIVSGGIGARGGTESPLSLPADIVINTDGSLLVVGGLFGFLDVFSASVMQVDPQSGDRIIVSSANENIGGGVSFAGPLGIAVETEKTLVVADLFLNAVVRVDLETGSRIILSK